MRVHSTSDIGQFYASIDNIAMSELAHANSLPPNLKPHSSPRSTAHYPLAPGGGQVVVDLPGEYLCSVLTQLGAMEEVLIDDVDLHMASGAVSTAFVRMAPNHAMPLPLPNPFNLGPEESSDGSLDPAGKVPGTGLSPEAVVVQLSPLPPVLVTDEHHATGGVSIDRRASAAPVEKGSGFAERQVESGKDVAGLQWDPVLKPLDRRLEDCDTDSPSSLPGPSSGDASDCSNEPPTGCALLELADVGHLKGGCKGTNADSTSNGPCSVPDSTSSAFNLASSNEPPTNAGGWDLV